MSGRTGLLGLLGALAVVSFAGAAISGCGGSSHGDTFPQGTFTLSPTNGSTLPPATTAAAYNQIVTVVMGGTPPYTFTPISVPPGLSLIAVPVVGNEVQITGTPAQVGSATVSFQIIDSTNQKFSNASYQLTVN